MLMSSSQSQLLVVDIQARLMPAMAEPDRVIANSMILIAAARRLDIPVTASAQYPKGLGAVVPKVAGLLSEDEILEKVDFSCAADSGLSERLHSKDRPSVLICGVETHVCVLQSALGLAAKGMTVYTAMDACSSRSLANWELAGHRLRQNGIETVSTEMACFEWLGQAGTDAFRDIAKLIK